MRTQPQLEELIADIIAHYRNARRTFTEADACGPLEDQGYTWNPALDGDALDENGQAIMGKRRFLIARNGDATGPTEWYLASQTVANALLLERLQAGEWDGADLDAQLVWLDEQTPGSHHIFCEKDPRFEYVAGRWHLSGEAEDIAVPPEIRDCLKSLWPQVLAFWQKNPVPLTVQQLTKNFEAVGFDSMPQQKRWLWVRSWLANQLFVRRVGADTWILAEALPSAPTRSRLSVLPQHDARPAPHLHAQFDAIVPRAVSNSPGIVPVAVPSPIAAPIPANNAPRANAHWTVTLRAIHTIEGFLPVPVEARPAYPPRLRGETALCAVTGQWFATGESLWLWLDRDTHRLYGPDLKEKLEWCEVGLKLSLAWNGELLRISEAGCDETVAQEESRLVDIEELARLRRGLGESYRTSIATILEFSGPGLTLREIVEKLSNRQGHPVHAGTVRAILRAGGFAHKSGHWFLPHPDQSAANLRQSLLKALLTNQNPIPASKTQEQSEPVATLQAIKERLKEIGRL